MDALEKRLALQDFGHRLRIEREKHHFSQERLADLVGCDVRSIRRWEQGESMPDYENRRGLSQALGKEGEALPPQFFHPEVPHGQGGDETTPAPLEERMAPPSSPPLLQDEPQRGAPPARLALPQRRALLTCGGIALVGLTVGSGAWYWFTRSSSPLLYTYWSPSKTGISDVEWSPRGDALACVNENTSAQVIQVRAGTYHPSLLTPAITCLAWSPDGTHLASPSGETTLRIWDPLNGIDSMRIHDLTEQPECVAWSPDGMRIALGGMGRSIRSWDAQTGTALLTYRGHRGTVWWLAWSPDTRRLASAGADGTVRVWSTTTGHLLHVYTGHTKAVMDVKWSRTGRWIVSASEDTTVQVWDAQTGATKLTYRGHNASVQAAEWSPDEHVIASCGADTTVQVWDAFTGKGYATYHDHTNTVWTLAWSPDGHRLASSSADGTLRIWQVKT